jgi:hypothetical protein
MVESILPFEKVTKTSPVRLFSPYHPRSTSFGQLWLSAYAPCFSLSLHTKETFSEPNLTHHDDYL